MSSRQQNLNLNTRKTREKMPSKYADHAIGHFFKLAKQENYGSIPYLSGC